VNFRFALIADVPDVARDPLRTHQHGPESRGTARLTSVRWQRARGNPYSVATRATRADSDELVCASGSDFHVGSGSTWRWHWLAVRAEPLDVERDSISHAELNLGARGAGCDAPRDVGRVGGESGGGWFDQDDVAAHRLTPAGGR